MTHVTCRLTAENRDQLRNPTLGNRITFSLPFLRSFGRAAGAVQQAPTLSSKHGQRRVDSRRMRLNTDLFTEEREIILRTARTLVNSFTTTSIIANLK